MDLHEEIAKMAHELYIKSGCMEGRDRENWLEAERLVLASHASQELEEPEGEERIIAEQGIEEEVEETTLRQAVHEGEEESTVMEEVEPGSPAIARKKGAAIKEAPEKIITAKKGGPAKKTAASKKGAKEKEINVSA